MWRNTGDARAECSDWLNRDRIIRSTRLGSASDSLVTSLGALIEQTRQFEYNRTDDDARDKNLSSRIMRVEQRLIEGTTATCISSRHRDYASSYLYSNYYSREQFHPSFTLPRRRVWRRGNFKRRDNLRRLCFRVPLFFLILRCYPRVDKSNRFCHTSMRCRVLYMYGTSRMIIVSRREILKLVK